MRLLGADGQPNGVLVDGGAALPSMPGPDVLKQYYANGHPGFLEGQRFHLGAGDHPG